MCLCHYLHAKYLGINEIYNLHEYMFQNIDRSVSLQHICKLSRVFFSFFHFLLTISALFSRKIEFLHFTNDGFSFSFLQCKTPLFVYFLSVIILLEVVYSIQVTRNMFLNKKKKKKKNLLYLFVVRI